MGSDGDSEANADGDLAAFGALLDEIANSDSADEASASDDASDDDSDDAEGAERP